MILAVGTLTAVCLFIARQNNLAPFHKSPTDTSSLGATEKSDTEKQQTNTLQNNPTQKLQAQDDTPPDPTIVSETGKYAVNVVVTSVGVFGEKIEARGYVTNITEEGGTCRYVFTSSRTVVKSTSTHVNPTSTTCVTSIFPSSELSSGTWSVYIEYESTNSYGKSSTKEFHI